MSKKKASTARRKARSAPPLGSALLRALDEGQEVHIFKLLGSGYGYCVKIHGDCYIEERSHKTLATAVTKAAARYAKWSGEE